MYFAVGLATVILGGILPPLVLHYRLSYATGGELVFMQFVGFLLGVPSASLIIHHRGFKVVLVASGLFIALSLCMAAWLPDVALLSVLCLVNGFGIAAAETSVATLTMEAFVGRRAVVMSYLEVAFGLGALCMPALSSILIAHHIWQGSFVFAGILALLAAFAWLRIPVQHAPLERLSPAPERTAQDAVTSLTAPAARHTRRLLLPLFLLLIFFYVGSESSISSFLPAVFIPYLHEAPYIASLSVTTFWIAMVIGRAVTGWVIRKIPYARFLLFSCTGAVAMVALLCTARSAVICYILVFLLGLSMSGIYSVALVFANHTIADAARLVTSLVTVAAGLGGVFLPPLVGVALDHLATVQVILLIGCFLTLLLLTLLTIVFTGRRANRAHVLTL